MNKPQEAVSVLDEVDFEIELMQIDKINVDYILELLRNINFEDKKERDYAVRTAIKEVNESANEQMRSKKELLLEFLQRVAPELTSKDSIDEKFHNFEAFKRQQKIKRIRSRRIKTRIFIERV